ncbi:hypothetical protein [Sulfurimonas marina]|uniref:Uncharacterized protein n=1 Tax=Sulfurimonas marina TaxID=2590551 RepID=A0A7M3V941_9BACT|nr:hypothetical protein [Sulfurimonas marina]QOP40274.1 hypothetical protein FJR03_00370 [Sulfurimonas marina]
MKENIALIREVHHNLDLRLAEEEAVAMLKKIELEQLADKRQRDCSNLEKFYVMLIRAVMCDAQKILIRLPFSIIDSIVDPNELLDNIKKLEVQKEFIFLDTIANKSHYDKISDQKVVIDAL